MSNANFAGNVAVSPIFRRWKVIVIVSATLSSREHSLNMVCRLAKI